jgi:Na+/glutamate symporter
LTRLKPKELCLRLVACLLLLSGFLLVVAALVLLPGLGQRFGFTVAALGVEALGVALLTRAYSAMQQETPKERR